MGDAIKTKNYALIMQVKILIEAQERQVTQQRGIYVGVFRNIS